MPDGEGFLQRVERRTVNDVFDAGDVLGTLDGGEVQLRDDALDFAEHGILFVDEFLQFLDVIAGSASPVSPSASRSRNGRSVRRLFSPKVQN